MWDKDTHNTHLGSYHKSPNYFQTSVCVRWSEWKGPFRCLRYESSPTAQLVIPTQVTHDSHSHTRDAHGRASGVADQTQTDAGWTQTQRLRMHQSHAELQARVSCRTMPGLCGTSVIFRLAVMHMHALMNLYTHTHKLFSLQLNLYLRSSPSVSS